MECDLCGDQGALLLKAKCHLTAPLSVELDGNTLILRCYLPECGREVARFVVLREPIKGTPVPGYFNYHSYD